MSDDMAKELQIRLFLPVKIIKIVIVFMFFIGMAFIFGGLLSLIIAYKNTVSIFIFFARLISKQSLILLFRFYLRFLKKTTNLVMASTRKSMKRWNAKR